MTLEELQKLGSVSKELVVCKKYLATDASKFGNYSDEEKAKTDAVVLDNSVWVATPNREPPSRANIVYSYDGTSYGLWNRQNHSFSTMELINGSLVSKNIISLSKGETLMANLDENALDKQVEEAGKAGVNPAKMDFGADVPAPKKEKTQAEKDAEKQKREQKKKEKEIAMDREVNRIKQQANQANVNFSIDPKLIDFNRKHGRFLGFFTSADPVVKVALKQTPINFGTAASPQYMLKEGISLDAEQEKKFANGTKNIGTKYLKCKSDIVIRQSGPGTVVAGIVKTPTLTEITDISELNGSKQATNDALKCDTFVLKVLPKEALFAYLELNYDKKIQEDESIPNHTQLIVRATEVRDKKAAGTAVQTTKYRNRISAEGRSLLVPGNFFPLETYDTVVLAGATAEQKVLLNNNFAAVMASYHKAPSEGAAPKGELSEEAKNLVTIDNGASNPAQGSYVCTSAIVDKGVSKQYKPFYAKGKNPVMEDVTALPIREAVPTKDGSKIRYVFAKSKFNEGENPAINRSEYASFIQRITDADSSVDFAAIAEKAKKTKRSSGTSTTTKKYATDKISGIEMLKLRANTAVQVDGASKLDDIFEMLKDAAV